METAIAERNAHGPYKSLEDFCLRLDSRFTNKRIIESLVKCGAFDLGRSPEHRAQLFASIEHAIGSTQHLRADRATGQGGLFDDFEIMEASVPARTAAFAPVEPWSHSETLAFEKELLGYFVSGHPLAPYAGHFDSGTLTPITDLIARARTAKEPITARIGGIITSLAKRYTRENKPFGIISLEDFGGSIEVSLWDKLCEEKLGTLEVNAAVSMGVRISMRDDKLRCTATSIGQLKPKATQRPVRLPLDRSRLTPEILAAIAKFAKDNPGKRPLVLEIFDDNDNMAALHPDESFSVADEDGIRAIAINALRV